MKLDRDTQKKQKSTKHCSKKQRHSKEAKSTKHCCKKESSNFHHKSTTNKANLKATKTKMQPTPGRNICYEERNK